MAFVMHIFIYSYIHIHLKVWAILYSIYPPFIGETALSAKSLRTPFLYLFSFGFQAFFLSARIFSTSSSVFLSPFIPTTFITLLGILISIKSFSSTRAIGPPSAASGEMCPIAGPLAAPENLPSVNSAIDAPYSASDAIASVV